METPDDNFENLRKLLALKRHEVPPPGFFEDFSGKVIARLEAGEARPSWWRRLLPGWESSPALVGAYATVVAALLIVGVQLSNPAGDASNPAVAPAPAVAVNEPVVSEPADLVVSPVAPEVQELLIPASTVTIPFAHEQGPSRLAIFTDGVPASTNLNSTSPPAGLFSIPVMETERAGYRP